MILISVHVITLCAMYCKLHFQDSIYIYYIGVHHDPNSLIIHTEMENFIVFVVIVLVCINVNMTNAQGEGTL